MEEGHTWQYAGYEEPRQRRDPVLFMGMPALKYCTVYPHGNALVAIDPQKPDHLVKIGWRDVQSKNGQWKSALLQSTQINHDEAGCAVASVALSPVSQDLYALDVARSRIAKVYNDKALRWIVLNSPRPLALDSALVVGSARRDGRVERDCWFFVSLPSERCVIRLDTSTNKVEVFAGDGSAQDPLADHGGLATPSGLFFDEASQHLFIADAGRHRVYAVAMDRTVTETWDTTEIVETRARPAPSGGRLPSSRPVDLWVYRLSGHVIDPMKLRPTEKCSQVLAWGDEPVVLLIADQGCNAIRWKQLDRKDRPFQTAYTQSRPSRLIGVETGALWCISSEAQQGIYFPRPLETPKAQSGSNASTG